MSKFCSNCGNQLPDEANVCTKCGKVLAEVPVQPQQTVPVQDTPPVQPNNDYYSQAPAFAQPVSNPNGFANKLKTDKKFMGIIIGAVAAIVAVVIILILLLGGGSGDNGSYKGAVDIYIDVMNGDADSVEYLCPPQYWDYLKDEEGTDMDEIIDEFETSYKSMAKMYEMSVGKNFEFSMEILDEEKMSDDDLEEALENIEDYGIKEITDGYCLKVELTIEGDDDSKTQKATIYSVEIDGKWYLLNESFDMISF